MRKYVIAIALAAAFYIDTVLFGARGSPVFWPNTVLAVIAALSVMGGAAPFAAVGIGIGFVIDVVYNKYIGSTSLSLLIAALAGGAFYNKFYADNVIVPARRCSRCIHGQRTHTAVYAAYFGRKFEQLFYAFAHAYPAVRRADGRVCSSCACCFQKSSVQVALAS